MALVRLCYRVSPLVSAPRQQVKAPVVCVQGLARKEQSTPKAARSSALLGDLTAAASFVNCQSSREFADFLPTSWPLQTDRLPHSCRLGRVYI